MQTQVFLNVRRPSPRASTAAGPSRLRASVVERALRSSRSAIANPGAAFVRQGAGDPGLRARLVDAVDQAVVAVGPDGSVVAMNLAAEVLYRCSAAWAEGRPAGDVLSWDLDDTVAAERLRCAPEASPWTGDVVIHGSEPRTVSMTITPVRVGGEVAAMAVTACETLERDAAREALHHHLTHDETTGLPNRRGVIARIDEVIDEYAASGNPIVVIRLDLDGLRTISDAFGESAACGVTRSVAEAVGRAVHRGDVVARASDASLVVCCPHLTGEEQARELADRLRSVVSHPVVTGATRASLRAAAGIVVDDGDTCPDELLHRADIAVAHEHDLGRNETTVYDHALRGQILRQVDVEALIRRALATGEVSLAYQPVVSLPDQAIVGAEALLRMTDDAGEPVPPPEVIGIAERTGLIAGLGLVILRTACKEAARWQRLHPERPLGVAVNVSASQLEDDAFPEHVEAALRASGLHPARLTLEMTETVLMADSARSTRQLARLKMIGVHLSADDFGPATAPSPT